MMGSIKDGSNQQGVILQKGKLYIYRQVKYPLVAAMNARTEVISWANVEKDFLAFLLLTFGDLEDLSYCNTMFLVF